MESPSESRKFERFVRDLASSGLIAADELDRQLRDFRDRPDANPPPASELTNFGSWLANRGLITGWQYMKLCDGKWKGFFLDGYKLFGHLDTDDAYSYYSAVHVTTGSRVTLRITPQANSKTPGLIEYLVMHPFP